MYDPVCRGRSWVSALASQFLLLNSCFLFQAPNLSAWVVTHPAPAELVEKAQTFCLQATLLHSWVCHLASRFFTSLSSVLQHRRHNVCSVDAQGCSNDNDFSSLDVHTLCISQGPAVLEVTPRRSPLPFRRCVLPASAQDWKFFSWLCPSPVLAPFQIGRRGQEAWNVLLRWRASFCFSSLYMNRKEHE